MAGTSTTVHFTITGEFVTGTARDLWLEGSYAKAFKILDCMIGMTREQQEQILFGKKKLVGENELDFVDDDWTPREDCLYPTITEALDLGNGEVQQELRRYRWADAYGLLHKNFHDMPKRAWVWKKVLKLVGEEEASRIWSEVMEEVSDAAAHGGNSYYKTEKGQKEEAHGRMLREANEPAPAKDPIADIYKEAQETLQKRAVEMGLDPAGVADPEAMANRGYGKKPRKDNKMKSKCGWLLPNGWYYGCGSMEHIGLAFELLKDKHAMVAKQDADPEQVAEAYGWVKITYGLTGLSVSCQKPVCQQQLDKIFDYCEVHGHDYEKACHLLDKE